MAETQFRELLSRYPTHDKAAGGLLKVGLSQYGEGKVDQAQQTLEAVVAQYPARTPRAPRRTACSRSASASRSADPLRTMRAL
jgi:TolA-binding protein